MKISTKAAKSPQIIWNVVGPEPGWFGEAGPTSSILNNEFEESIKAHSPSPFNSGLEGPEIAFCTPAPTPAITAPPAVNLTKSVKVFLD